MSKIRDQEKIQSDHFDEDEFQNALWNEMIKQAEKVIDISDYKEHSCSEEDKIACALKYGPQAIDNKILVSISENINTMAQAINESERQKSNARDKYVTFFQVLLVLLLIFTAILISADTFLGYTVRIEFLISVILAILADIFAIVHTLVKYMTNLEHYEAYNKLIDSLLQSVDHGTKNKGISEKEDT